MPYKRLEAPVTLVAGLGISEGTPWQAYPTEWVYGDIDLGLAVGEAARILGVYINIKHGLECSHDGFQQVVVGITFDPTPDGDTSSLSTDEQVFAMFDHSMEMESGTADVLARRNEEEYFNFAGMNLVAIRNLGVRCQAESDLDENTQEFTINIKVWYEKYYPATQDLNALLARRI